MREGQAKCDSMSIEEATISNMWEMVEMVEVLERKGLCTKFARKVVPRDRIELSTPGFSRLNLIKDYQRVIGF